MLFEEEEINIGLSTDIYIKVTEIINRYQTNQLWSYNNSRVCFFYLCLFFLLFIS